MTDAEIYESVRWDLMRYAVALIGPTDAEDVVSTVITRALGRKGGLSGLIEPRQYLLKGVLNETRSRYRIRARRLFEPLGSSVITDPQSGPDEQLGNETDRVVAVIQSLPPRQRAAAFLVFFEEYTPTEAAATIGCRPGTVRRYLHLARRKLEGALS